MRARTALNQQQGQQREIGELDPIEQLRTSGRALEDSFISVTIDAQQRLTEPEPQSKLDSDNAHFDGEIKEDPRSPIPDQRCIALHTKRPRERK